LETTTQPLLKILLLCRRLLVFFDWDQTGYADLQAGCWGTVCLRAVEVDFSILHSIFAPGLIVLVVLLSALLFIFTSLVLARHIFRVRRRINVYRPNMLRQARPIEQREEEYLHLVGMLSGEPYMLVQKRF
jgi:hypothetical protein